MSILQLQNKENVLELNTPNRQEILKDGAPLCQVKSNLLGRGTFGTVIKAIYKAKPVALKIIKNTKDANKQMLQNESRILGWRHTNIVKILKIESTANFAIVIMERFDGQCLQSVLNTTHIALSHRVNIALDIISAIAFCHRKCILHMDIKPQNFMIFLNKTQPLRPTLSSNGSRSYTCKLCDFGSSIDLNENKHNIKGQFKGTLRYMAPEALKEECLTPASDIYSLGITLWQMKYRKYPYYWLECNEVVAYQVVKHNLRPNTKSKVKNTSCECNTTSTIISSKSFENLLEIFNENEWKLIEPQLQKENVRTINSKKVNAKRNLQYEFIMNESPHALTSMLQNHQTSSHHRLQQQSVRVLAADIAERLYEEIFISCWHSDYRQRPSTSELYKQFNKLL